MILTHGLPEVIASSVNPAPRYRDSTAISAVNVNGNANSLRLTVLHQHFDWVDGTRAGVRTEVAETSNELIRSVDGYLEGSTAIGLSAEYLQGLFEGANAVATRTDTFCSAVIAVRVGARTYLASIGSVSVFRARAGRFMQVIEPTAIRPFSASPQMLVLTAAIGSGFEASKVQICDLTMGHGEMLALIVKPDEMEPMVLSEVPAPEVALSPASFLAELVERLVTPPPILAVVAGPAG